MNLLWYRIEYEFNELLSSLVRINYEKRIRENGKGKDFRKFRKILKFLATATKSNAS